MTVAKPIEFAEQRHDFFRMNKKTWRLHYTHDPRIPEDLRGKPVKMVIVKDSTTVSGTPRNVPHEYYHYLFSARLRRYLPLRKSLSYKAHRVNYLMFYGTQPRVIHHKNGNGLDNSPTNLVGSTERLNIHAEISRKPSATNRYVASRLSGNNERFQATISRSGTSYSGPLRKREADAVLDAAYINVVVDGADRAERNYVELLHARDIFADALLHRNNGTFPDFVRLYQYRKAA